MAYPEWVLKHKTKGTYLNCVNGRYYLYAAHSERIPGTKKVKRIFDGCLGRITEEDGFIPVKDKINTEILVFEYGFSAFILQICKRERLTWYQNTGKYADFVLVASILSVLHGSYDHQKLSVSYLSILYPSLHLGQPINAEVSGHIEKLTIAIKRFLENLPAQEQKTIFTELPYVYKVQLNQRWYESQQSEAVYDLLKNWHM